MIDLAPPFRLAEPRDAPVLAQLVDAAGEGLPYRFWAALAAQGEDPWEVGRRRQAAAAQAGKIVVVDAGEGPVAGLTGYVIGPKPVALENLPPLQATLQALENLALDSWYVNVLAVLPETRGRGFGSSLLGLAEAIARAEGLARTSVVVADDNVGARRLYARVGYVEAATRPLVTPEGERTSRSWLLMIKDLSASR